MYMYIFLLAGFVSVSVLALLTTYKIYRIVSNVSDLPMRKVDQMSTVSVSMGTVVMSVASVIVSASYVYGLSSDTIHEVGIAVSAVLIIVSSICFSMYSILVRFGSIKNFVHRKWVN